MHTGRGELLTAGWGEWGGGGKCLQSARVTSIVSQETSHVTLFSRGKQMKHRVGGLQESAAAPSDAAGSSGNEEV